MDLTVLGVFLSFVIALGLAGYQYLYRSFRLSKIKWLLFLLRFLAVFGLLLLLLDFKLEKKSYEIIKPVLVLAIDNSSSIKDFKEEQKARVLSNKIISDQEIKAKFDLKQFVFDSDIREGDSLDFLGSQTRIDKLAKNLSTIFRGQNYTTLLLTDGNQTQGDDYLYAFPEKSKVFPIVLGDTLKQFDLRINKLNVNRYAFLGNKFPVEIFMDYQGDKSVMATLTLIQKEKILHKERLSFSKNQTSHSVTLFLEANSLGLQTYQAVLSTSEPEKNRYNNSRNFAVEVIDQRTEVALISEISHPDLGALKRSIESNKQNKVTLLAPQDVKNLDTYNVVLLYQPTTSFRRIFEHIQKERKNYLVLTGKHTDFNFLGTQQDVFNYKSSGQLENFGAEYQKDFSVFMTEDIGFTDFPPLENPFGIFEPKAQIQTLLSARVRTLQTEKPLLLTSEGSSGRTIVLFGEGIWKWRLHYYAQHDDFVKYDEFIHKMIRFLATENSRKQMLVAHEKIYNQGEPIQIIAQYFDKNYEFDSKADLDITLLDSKGGHKIFDLIREANQYKVNLEGLTPGSYTFKIKENTSGATYSGGFEVIDFDIEKQFTHVNYDKLQQLASRTNGAVLLADKTDELLEMLKESPDYKPIQKVQTKREPLIEFWFLLPLIISLLGAEWLIRKYNGLL